MKIFNEFFLPSGFHPFCLNISVGKLPKTWTKIYVWDKGKQAMVERKAVSE